MADDLNDPKQQYGPEYGNLGPLRFMYSVPFGPQLAAAAQAAGARFRGEADSFGDSYNWHRGQNDQALAALAKEKSGLGYQLAEQVPYLVTGPAGAAAYAASASASRGEPFRDAAIHAALVGAPTHGPSGPVDVGPMMAAPIKLPGGREKPFPNFEETRKGFRLPDGSIHDTGPFHDITKLPEPYNNPDNVGFVDDGFILTGMKSGQKKNGFIVEGGNPMPDHFVKRADFNNPDKTRPEAWGLPDWAHLSEISEGARGTGRNDPMEGQPRYQMPPAPAPVTNINDAVIARAAKAAYEKGKAGPPASAPPNEYMTSAEDPNAWFNRPAGTKHPFEDRNQLPRVGEPPQAQQDQEFRDWMISFLRNAGPAAASNWSGNNPPPGPKR